MMFNWKLTKLEATEGTMPDLGSRRFGDGYRGNFPILNGHLHYPDDIDRPLNESTVDKIRDYRADYNNRPSNSISFMSVVASTSGRLHCERVRISFLQAHRETDRFLI